MLDNTFVAIFVQIPPSTSGFLLEVQRTETYHSDSSSSATSICPTHRRPHIRCICFPRMIWLHSLPRVSRALVAKLYFLMGINPAPVRTLTRPRLIHGSELLFSTQIPVMMHSHYDFQLVCGPMPCVPLFSVTAAPEGIAWKGGAAKPPSQTRTRACSYDSACSYGLRVIIRSSLDCCFGGLGVCTTWPHSGGDMPK